MAAREAAGIGAFAASRDVAHWARWISRDRFIVAPDAWLRCREDGEDPDWYLVSPFVENPPIEVTLRGVTVR